LNFSVQSYLRYQAEKFLDRFDANCYLSLIKKMNTHDITRGRTDILDPSTAPEDNNLRKILSRVPRGSLVIGVGSDLLFPIQEQHLIAQCIPGATFAELQSDDGHDGFLLDFRSLETIIRHHLVEKFPLMYEGPDDLLELPVEEEKSKDSVVGEIEIFDY
jgi:homoserine O-acetyltransferase